MGKLWLPDPRMEMPELLEPGKKPIGNVVIKPETGVKFSALGGRSSLSGEPVILGADASIIVTVKGKTYSVPTNKTTGVSLNYRMPAVSRYSAAILFRFNGVTSSNRRFNFGQIQTGGTGKGTYYDWGFPYFGSAREAFWFVKNGSAVEGPALTENQWYVMSVSYASGGTDGARLFIDGSLRATGTVSGFTSSDYDAKIGYRWGSNNPNSVDVAAVFLAPDRVWSDAQHQKIAENLYSTLLAPA